MKRYLTLLALIASPAVAQTTQCYQLGRTITCNTSQVAPIAAPQDLTPLYLQLMRGDGQVAYYPPRRPEFTHEQYCAGVVAQGLPPMRGC